MKAKINWASVLIYLAMAVISVAMYAMLFYMISNL
jgi:hypothetical protein